MTVPPALPSDSMPMKYAFVVAPPAAAGIDISAVVCVAVNVPEASDVRRTFASKLASFQLASGDLVLLARCWNQSRGLSSIL